MGLILGTVQFGLAYGISGPGAAVPEAEVRAILDAAAAAGVRRLDTAPVYGDIEARVAGLAGAHPFRITTKLPPRPAGLSPAEAADWTRARLGDARAHLGARIDRVLWHRAADLAGEAGRAAWQAAAETTAGWGVRLGASLYDPAELPALAALPGFAAVQVPGNALDRRFAAPLAGTGLAVDVRSVYLQGLLVADRAAMAARLPAAAAVLARWHRWCAENGLTPVEAALAAARALYPQADLAVGVQSRAELDETLAALDRPPLSPDPALAVEDPEIIRPDRWRPAP